jgi:hypothetical protein
LAERHAFIAKRHERVRHIEMRSHEQLGRSVEITDVAEQEKREETSTAAADVDPPRPTNVVAAVDMPARVAGIELAWEASADRSPTPSRRCQAPAPSNAS